MLHYNTVKDQELVSLSYHTISVPNLKNMMMTHGRTFQYKNLYLQIWRLMNQQMMIAPLESLQDGRVCKKMHMILQESILNTIKILNVLSSLALMVTATAVPPPMLQTTAQEQLWMVNTIKLLCNGLISLSKMRMNLPIEQLKSMTVKFSKKLHMALKDLILVIRQSPEYKRIK